MRIYLAHSSAFDFHNELYQPLKKCKKIDACEFIFPHESAAKMQISKEIIRNCDLILAEISYASTGMGIELGWAESLGKPIICLHRKGVATSRSTKLLARKVVEYSGPADLTQKVEEILKLPL